MPNTIVLSTTAHLHDQVIQDVLISKEAMDYVRDWVGEFMAGAGSVRSWTPYWKEIVVRRPGNAYVGFRFRLGGPVEVSQSQGWSVAREELVDLEETLVPLLDELGRAMTQRRVADAIQSEYPLASRQVRDDDTLLVQMPVTPESEPPASTPATPMEVAIIIQPSLKIRIFVRCRDETAGRAIIRRLTADLQVAGLPVTETSAVAVKRIGD